MRDEPVSETQSEIEGRQYRFCGPSCRERFLQRPADYAVSGRTQP